VRKGTCLCCWRWMLAIILFAASMLVQNVPEIQATLCDPDPPVVSITIPIAGGGSYQTDQPVVDLAGQASDDIGVTKILWKNDQGGGGTAHATANWEGPCFWEAKGITLSEGDNLITITALDTAGNSAEATLTVTYTFPLPPPKDLVNKQAKFTFNFGGTVYNNIDRFSIVANLLKEKTEIFEMPYNTDVTVTVKVPDPRDPTKQIQLFTQTVPAGTVTGSSKYRYLPGFPGIHELYIERNTATTIYLYLFVDDIELLPSIKPTLSPTEYQNFVKTIKTYNFTVRIGDRIYSGDAPLTPGTYTAHKQELVYNR
jgi:hypothetical protein